jgi:F-type H+-transporting ATPase subunit c
MMLLVVLFIAASPILAADGTGVTGTIKDWKVVSAGIGMAIASGLCGLAQGNAVKGATEAMARNPGASAGIRFALILGLVLIESLALYTLVIIYSF